MQTLQQKKWSYAQFCCGHQIHLFLPSEDLVCSSGMGWRWHLQYHFLLEDNHLNYLISTCVPLAGPLVSGYPLCFFLSLQVLSRLRSLWCVGAVWSSLFFCYILFCLCIWIVAIFRVWWFLYLCTSRTVLKLCHYNSSLLHDKIHTQSPLESKWQPNHSIIIDQMTPAREQLGIA